MRDRPSEQVEEGHGGGQRKDPPRQDRHEDRRQDRHEEPFEESVVRQEAASGEAAAVNDPGSSAEVVRRPSMADVAALAGVSAQTVSRVANGRLNVDPATRQKVLEAMAALRYRANSAARSLATGSFRSIGVIASTLTTYGAQQALDGVAEEARLLGYDVTLMPLRSPSVEEVSGAADVMLGRHNVDAIVVGVESTLLDRLAGGWRLDVPVVVTDGGGSAAFSSVDSDPGPGLRAALLHLIELGHTTIWYISGPKNSSASRHRRAVWEQFLDERGLPAAPVLLSDWSSASGYSAGVQVAEAVLAAHREHPRSESLSTEKFSRGDTSPLVAMPSIAMPSIAMPLDAALTPTAVACANDQVALGLIRALADRGVDVPAQVSVVGFDDTEASRYSVPRLSTIRHDVKEVGRRAVRVLVRQLSPEVQTGPTGLVSSYFVDRESTAPARSG